MTQDEFESLIRSLANMPADVRRLVEDLSPDEKCWKPPGGEFSVTENVCHLRDIEVDGYAVRIKRMLLEDRPALADIDGAKLAAERDYNNQDLVSSLEVFAMTRQDSLDMIRGLTFDQLDRTGTLENAGVVSLRRLLELLREHDEVHLRELNELADNRARRAEG